MKSEMEFLSPLKLFCKERGVTKAFKVDGSRTEKSDKVRSFLNKVGTTLRVLERQTQHTDRAEL